MILDKFLNLKGTSIQGYRHLENIGIVFRIESKNKKAICPRCRLESEQLHQNHRHLVKDLPCAVLVNLAPGKLIAILEKRTHS